MGFLIFILGGLAGIFLNTLINKISYNISKNTEGEFNILVPLITGIIFFISYLRFQGSIIFIKAIILGCILIVVSFIDLKYRIIPNTLVIVALVLGIIFSFIGDISFSSSILGMIIGGGLLLLFSLIPDAMGGGDIKLMFALGGFLGYRKTLIALILSFALASFISILLLLFKIKGRKDQIPFGPFLALGTFGSLLFFT